MCRAPELPVGGDYAQTFSDLSECVARLSEKGWTSDLGGMLHNGRIVREQN